MTARSLLSAGFTLTHAGLLLLLVGWGVWHLRKDRGAALCALFVLIWTDLVCTALVLSCFSSLGNRFAYVGVSLTIAAIMATFVSRHLATCRVSSASDVADETVGSPFDKIASGVFWLAILGVVMPTAMICAGYDPNNYDSVAYRLPRAFLYIAQGMLSHPPIGDFRMQFYPFDTTLGYLAFAIHGLAGRWMNLFGFVTWLMGGVAVGRAAQEFGAARTARLFAATLYLTAPAVMVSASSGNDDLIAGVPLLIGLIFAARWWRSSNAADAALAAMGFGLSAGSKLHLPFLLPVAALFCAMLLYRMSARGRLRQFLRGRFLQIGLAACIMATLFLPALVINVVESGHATPDIPNFQNRPFSPAIAGVNTLVDSASLFLAPVPDLDLDPSAERRKALYDSFNTFGNRYLFPWIPPHLDFSNTPYYHFEGIASADGYLGVWDQSAWLGFIPWLLATVVIFALPEGLLRSNSVSGRLRSAAFWFAVAFFGWHLARCFSIKYVGGQGIYYAFILAFAAPALAWLWAGNGIDRRGRVLLRLAGIVVLGTNLVSAVNALAFNYQRNIPDLLRAQHFDPRPSDVDADLKDALAASHHTLIAFTQWELPLFDFMTAQPKARYALTSSLPAAAVSGYDLSLTFERTRAEYGEVPVQFAHDDRDRLSLLGTMLSAYGEQRGFGHNSHGPDSPPHVIGSYQAGKDGGGIEFVSGWAPSEPTQRSSSGDGSVLAFDLPPQEIACALDLRAETSGVQNISVTLNGEPAGSLERDSTGPEQSLVVPLPDSMMIPGQRNTVSFTYDRPDVVQPGARSLVLDEAAVTCRHALSDITPRNWNVIFSYSADKNAENVSFESGWSVSERTHRWSDGPESQISFRLPAASRACTFQAVGITAGTQTITAVLNGHTLDPIHLQAWFPGSPFEMSFPDEFINAAERNSVVFRYDHTEAAGGRNLALGLIRASLRCRKGDVATVTQLESLRPNGFAVLALDESRNGNGGVTRVTLNRIEGIAPEEEFSAAISLLSSSGAMLFESAPRRRPFGQAFEIPGAPREGSLKVTLTRVDRTEIEASVYVPIAVGTPLPLDLRRFVDISQ